eukprot:Blabericola_migrator_1__5490@NODE_27_length_20109_cov_273_259006_g24_i0_p10_GENE_NODE_27_length_20109_cov_273_259006_g24_i0NODE_27_length_20109_cov_273_259006_g24_i0_p10_ORF_typecomplete_len137_score14_06tRNA_int_endo/PF01974_17/0_00014_NODE_27_length_20109_cov_273_259006_g24_i01841918829
MKVELVWSTNIDRARELAADGVNLSTGYPLVNPIENDEVVTRFKDKGFIVSGATKLGGVGSLYEALPGCAHSSTVVFTGSKSLPASKYVHFNRAAALVLKQAFVLDEDSGVCQVDRYKNLESVRHNQSFSSEFCAP